MRPFSYLDCTKGIDPLHPVKRLVVFRELIPSPSLGGLDALVFIGNGDGVGTVHGSQLTVDIPAMSIHGIWGDTQLHRDLSVCIALGD